MYDGVYFYCYNLTKGETMTKMPQEVIDLFNDTEVAYVVTASLEGQPNAVPVTLKKVIDEETIYVSDQFFKKTYANFMANPKVAISFCNDTTSYQMYGTARYVNEGEEFAELKAWADAKLEAKGKPFRAKGGLFIDVTEVYTCTSGPTAGDRIA